MASEIPWKQPEVTYRVSVVTDILTVMDILCKANSLSILYSCDTGLMWVPVCAVRIPFSVFEEGKSKCVFVQIYLEGRGIR